MLALEGGPLFMQMPVLSEPVKRLLFLGMVALGVILLLGLAVSSLAAVLHPSTPIPAPPAKTLLVSPLLFGTNLDFSPRDPQLQPTQIASTQHTLQSLHVQIVRLSLPDQPTAQQITREAQAIKQIGAIPLLSLHTTWSPHALTDNALAIATISLVFGKQAVYYEYGDEEDAVGMTADQYGQSWNQMIPRLKVLAPQAQFVGPATYHYDPHYFQAFLQQARPLPNAVSWHEFPCDASWSQSQCLTGIDLWTSHLTSARNWMSQHLHTTLPVMITAWNYAANPVLTDGKSTDTTFMSTWTQKALQTLAANQVFASMQYSGVNTPAPLISQNNTLTSQGQTFLALYKKFVFQSSPETAPSLTSTPSSTATPSSTSTRTVTPTAAPTPSLVPTATNTPIVTPTPTLVTIVVPTPIVTPTPTPVTIVVPTPTPTHVPPTPTPKPVCPPTIQSGSTGTWVKTLQQDLNSRGITDQNGNPLVVDGNFGTLTLSAVKKWQTREGISVDGVVGPITWHTLGHC
jgi:hypothetical protein